MITDTHIANAIDSIPSDRTQIDANAKEVLADVQILSRILKYTVTELKELSIDEIISLINPSQIEISTTPIDPGLTNLGKIEENNTENTILGEGTIYFDIRFSVYYKEKALKILLNIEAQKSTSFGKLHYHLENRIIYYMSRMISSQKNVEFFHDDYDNIKKVYSIWLCMNADINTASIDELFFTQKTSYGMPKHLPYLNKMHGIIISIPADKPYKDSKNILISMLQTLLSNIPATDKKHILSDKYAIKMTSTLERSISKMCNISEFFIEQATENGLKRGLEQGIEQGIEALVSTLKKLKQSNEFILNEIIENFNLSEEDAMKYL